MDDKKYKWYKTHGTVYDSTTDRDVCIVYEHQGEEDLKLVLDSLNNYSKAIELLKEALDQLESMVEEETFTKRRIQEFLNEIENG